MKFVTGWQTACFLEWLQRLLSFDMKDKPKLLICYSSSWRPSFVFCSLFFSAGSEEQPFPLSRTSWGPAGVWWRGRLPPRDPCSVHSAIRWFPFSVQLQPPPFLSLPLYPLHLISPLGTMVSVGGPITHRRSRPVWSGRCVSQQTRCTRNVATLILKLDYRSSLGGCHAGSCICSLRSESQTGFRSLKTKRSCLRVCQSNDTSTLISISASVGLIGLVQRRSDQITRVRLDWSWSPLLCSDCREQKTASTALLSLLDRTLWGTERLEMTQNWKQSANKETRLLCFR